MSLEAIGNGGPHTNSVCEKEGAQSVENHVHPNVGGTSRRISAVKKTLAGWLRLDRSTSTQPASSHKIAQRSKSIENVRFAGSSGASRQTKNSDVPETRGRHEDRRVLSWSNWRRRMTSRSELPNHDPSSPDTQQEEPSSALSKSPQNCNSSVAKRALPPVPSPEPPGELQLEFVRDGNAAESPDPLDEDPAGLHGIAAYIEDRPDMDEEDCAFSSQPGKDGLIDFAASIEKVKSVRSLFRFFKPFNLNICHTASSLRH